MANYSSREMPEAFNIYNVKTFPPVINGTINVLVFLEATSDLLALIDQLGSAFAPGKYDMQGNIDKIKRFFSYDENSCLLALMLDEKNKGRHEGAESVLWLNRGLLFFELLFHEIIDCVKKNEFETSIQKILTTAYNASLKKYHNWVTQKLFVLILKISPTLPQVLKTLDPTQDTKKFVINLINVHSSLHEVRTKIDMFFEENNMFVGNK